MNDITIFNHLGNDIRVMTDTQGEPWFVAKDVCTVLGYARVSNTITRHVDEDDALKRGIIDEVGRKQETLLINESGLYALIMSSKLPEAKAFRRWVTSEVLPSIRKRGGYLTPEASREALRDPDFIIQLAMDLKEERARAAQAEAARAKAEAEVEAQRPVAALGKAIETAEGDLAPSAFGKILSKTIKTVGPNKFCRWLLDNNFAFRNGQGKIRPQLLVTPAGQSYFAGILSA